MIRLTVTDEHGAVSQWAFEHDEVTVGRVAGNDVVLPGYGVSKRHARIYRRGRAVYVVDLKSTNGVFVNEQRVGAPTPVAADDHVAIGSYSVAVALDLGASAGDEGGDEDTDLDALRGVREPDVAGEPTQAIQLPPRRPRRP